MRFLWTQEGIRMKVSARSREGGFNLVELMVVVAIVAILAAVAIPAYKNYVNRVRQSEAANLLMAARLEMEEFFIDRNRYTGTIGCLPSFASTSCLANCGTCTITSCRPKYYTFVVENFSSNYYRIAATRKIYPYARTDRVYISSSTANPVVANVDALKFSVYKWLFE